MQFFTSAIDTLQTLVVALGAGLGVWGAVDKLAEDPQAYYIFFANAHVR